MTAYYTRARMTVSAAPNAGVITLGGAVSGYQSFVAAGIQNADLVPYVAESGYTNGIPSVWEYGYGTYASSGTTLTRTTILGNSSGTTTAMTLGSDCQVFISPLASDITPTPSGAILNYAGATAPSGWLLCYGQAISRATYAALFTAIGTVYGAGDGSTTFNLPDLRGRSISGVDNMGGTAASRVTSGGSGVAGTTLGATGGAETVTLTQAQMPAHTHSAPNPGGAASATSGSGSGGNGSTTTGSTGGGGAHSNMQPVIMMNSIIKI